jgi:hypothetical protein
MSTDTTADRLADVLIPGPFAIAIFILADGVVGYRELAGGQLADLRSLDRALLEIGLLSLASLAAFGIFWRLAG